MLAGIEEALSGMTAIRAVMAAAIDYAGLYPPAGLDMEAAVRNYTRYHGSEDAWALGRFVAPVARAVETGLEGDALSLISGGLEHAGEILYVEGTTSDLPGIKAKGARAKIRTGGLEAQKFPSTQTLAAFIAECVRLRLPFKATAGLHHAIRGDYRLTYDPASAVTTMHGFLNVLIASCFAWHNGPVQPVLEEQDATNFRIVTDYLTWRDYRLTRAEIADARRYLIVSFGSCSFEEPLQELRSLGIL